MSEQLDPALIGRRYREVVEAAGPAVTVIVATKYVTVDEMDVLARAGIVTVGENRLADLEAKHHRYGSRFRWHFIGHLQSRKAPDVSRLVELVHSLDSISSARRLTVPALVQVNLSGEETKSGVREPELGAFLAAVRELGVDVRGLTTMPPLSDDPEASRPWFRRLAALAREHGLAELSMGTTQDWPVAVEEGATMIRVGSALFGDRRPV